ncbi:conserved protein of unknown function [Candidatus Hydrogenisulfobacillus filiaventi]|uniref:Uncharacterized protein n=1 Tax=Candidatus Hydrogenisulfobacillus filiaventi TaxID=2707344 RepID=A0A6F8ZFS2_9FIRM|nr:hypothetical protein [Bacillota bacterium]CAB1128312.1 conserved protein of unknown function [Candidatus Hydrogenisulfobacillus filiaventi]
MHTLETVAAQLTVVLSPLLTGLLLVAIYRGAAYLRHLADHLKVRTVREAADWAIAQAAALARTVVVALNQDVVNAAKRQGRWTPELARQVKAEAVAQIQSLLTREARRILADLTGDLATYLGTLVEAEVATAPNRRRGGGETAARAGSRP